MGKKRSTTAAPAAPYTPTEADKSAAERYLERMKTAPKLPAFKVTMIDGVPNISSDYPEESFAQSHQMNAFGLDKGLQLTSLLKSIVNLTARDGAIDEDGLNEVTALVVGIGPQNPIEAMLATQMTAVHLSAMSAAIRLRSSDTLEGRAINHKAFNNLTRTFAMQAEALKKLRSTGEQKVVVEHQHVHVYPGAQAVVGTLNQGQQEGGGTISDGQPHVRDRLLLSEGAAVLSDIEANRVPMPSAGSDGGDGVQVPRSSRRSPLRAV